MSIVSRLKIGTIVEYSNSIDYTLGVIYEVLKDRDIYQVNWLSHPGVRTNCPPQYLKILMPSSKLTRLIFKE